MLALDAQKTLRLKSWRATRIECVAGVLWVTREGDPRDFIIAPGESMEVDGGLTLAMALEPALVRVAKRPVWSRLRGILEPLRFKIRWPVHGRLGSST